MLVQRRRKENYLKMHLVLNVNIIVDFIPEKDDLTPEVNRKSDRQLT